MDVLHQASLYIYFPIPTQVPLKSFKYETQQGETKLLTLEISKKFFTYKTKLLSYAVFRYSILCIINNLKW